MSTSLPEWIKEETRPVTVKGQDGFLTHSLLEFCRLFRTIDLNKQSSDTKAHAGIKLLAAFILILLIALSPAFYFTLTVAAAFLLFLSFQRIEILKDVIESAAGAAFLSFVIMFSAALFPNRANGSADGQRNWNSFIRCLKQRAKCSYTALPVSARANSPKPMQRNTGKNIQTFSI